MSKKGLVLLLVLAILVVGSSLGVVSAQDDVYCPEGDATVRIFLGAVGDEFQLAQDGVDRFNAVCSNIAVELIETPDSTTDRLGLILQYAEAQSADVDIFQIDVIWPGILAEHLVDMSEYASEEVIAEHFPAIIENNTVNGALVGIPFFTDAGLLYYRTDLLEKYGIEAPGTWDELEAAAQTIQDGERAEGNTEFQGFVFQGNSYEGLTCDALEWMVSNGGGFISPTGEVLVNTPESIAAIERAAGWVGTISPEGVTAYQEEDARNVWQAGNAAFMRNWPYAYSLGNAEDSAVAGLFDVSPLPSGTDGGPRAATLGGWQLAVSKYSANVDAAAAVVLYLTSYEEQKVRAIERSYNPTIQGLYEDEEVLAAVPFFGSLYDVFISAAARPSTITSTRYNEVSTLYFQAVHSVLTGDNDAATAMEDLEIDLQEIVDEMMAE
ncbi:MAG: ABC transporter substrate-binding protein [Chitinophagaceae bacterium]|nr:ABC transporter substrate-binding protein [Anaerolineae bacterium]